MVNNTENADNMSFWACLIQPLKKYMVFKGRARRKEFCIFTVFYVLNLIMLMAIYAIIQKESSSDYFNIIGYSVIFFFFIISSIPEFALTVRRLHDIEYSGRFIFVALIPVIGVVALFYLLFIKEGSEKNKYGYNPKMTTDEIENKEQELNMEREALKIERENLNLEKNKLNKIKSNLSFLEIIISLIFDGILYSIFGVIIFIVFIIFVLKDTEEKRILKFIERTYAIIENKCEYGNYIKERERKNKPLSSRMDILINGCDNFDFQNCQNAGEWSKCYEKCKPGLYGQINKNVQNTIENGWQITGSKGSKLLFENGVLLETCRRDIYVPEYIGDYKYIDKINVNDEDGPIIIMEIQDNIEGWGAFEAFFPTDTGYISKTYGYPGSNIGTNVYKNGDSFPERFMGQIIIADTNNYDSSIFFKVFGDEIFKHSCYKQSSCYLDKFPVFGDSSKIFGYKTRIFYGEILKNVKGIIEYKKDLVNDEFNVSILKVVNGKVETQEIGGKTLDEIKSNLILERETLYLVRKGLCKELGETKDDENPN
jgi:uncharacterized membrane protein YhaH (DUF805 family)